MLRQCPQCKLHVSAANLTRTPMGHCGRSISPQRLRLLSFLGALKKLFQPDSYRPSRHLYKVFARADRTSHPSSKHLVPLAERCWRPFRPRRASAVSARIDFVQLSLKADLLIWALRDWVFTLSHGINSHCAFCAMSECIRDGDRDHRLNHRNRSWQYAGVVPPLSP